jgi:hypothetical protein
MVSHISSPSAVKRSWNAGLVLFSDKISTPVGIRNQACIGILGLECKRLDMLVLIKIKSHFRVSNIGKYQYFDCSWWAFK